MPNNLDVCKKIMKEKLIVSISDNQKSIIGKVVRITWDDSNDIIFVKSKEGICETFELSNVTKLIIK